MDEAALSYAELPATPTKGGCARCINCCQSRKMFNGPVCSGALFCQPCPNLLDKPSLDAAAAAVVVAAFASTLRVFATPLATQHLSLDSPITQGAARLFANFSQLVGGGVGGNVIAPRTQQVGAKL